MNLLRGHFTLYVLVHVRKMGLDLVMLMWPSFSMAFRTGKMPLLLSMTIKVLAAIRKLRTSNNSTSNYNECWGIAIGCSC